MISKRTLHLARCFQAITLSLGVPGVWVACSSGGSQGSPAKGTPDAASTDGTTGASDLDSSSLDASDASDAPDVAIGEDASSPADADASMDAPPVCWATYVVFDGGPDAEETCVYTLPCGLYSASTSLTAVGCEVFPALSDGGLDEAAVATFPVCTLLPGQGCDDGGYLLPDSGEVSFSCIGCPSGGGRRPAGFQREVGRGSTAIGAYLADLACLEAASVQAFEVLALELEAHGAPSHLVEAARASASDEVRHARALRRLAARFGGAPDQAGRAPAPPVRSLATLARENAVEGCIRETFGALVNAWQAARAADPDVRAAMEEIARDELRHAALSWEVQAWAEALLSGPERRSMARAKRKAVARVVASTARAPSREVRALLGLPDEEQALLLARGLLDRVWAEAVIPPGLKAARAA